MVLMEHSHERVPDKHASIGQKMRGGAIGQFKKTKHSTVKRKVNLQNQDTCCGRFKNMVGHPGFDSLFGALIFANMVVTCFEVQYKGFDMGYEVGYPYTSSAEDTWPGAGDVFEILTFFFGVAFTCELIIKLVYFRHDFSKNIFNWFDFIVVGVWLAEASGLANFLMNPNLLRTLCLVRLVRLAKAANAIQALDSLQVLVGSIKACFSILIWSGFVLVVVHTLVGLLLNALVEDYVNDDSNSLDKRRTLYSYFGTYTRIFITMYEITLGNWVPVTRILVEDLHDAYGPCILVYRFLVGFPS